MQNGAAMLKEGSMLRIRFLVVPVSCQVGPIPLPLAGSTDGNKIAKLAGGSDRHHQAEKVFQAARDDAQGRIVRRADADNGRLCQVCDAAENIPYFTINLNLLKNCCGAVELFPAMCVDRSERV
jgi:hypothetical protein